MDLETAPLSAGIYAWYFRPQFPRADIDACAQALAAATSRQERRAAVLELLQTTILQYVREAAYDAAVSGDLKPTYQGQLEHVQDIGPSVLDQYAANLTVFDEVRGALERTAIGFMSPLYIGKSSHLRERLLQHKAAILEDVRPGPRVESEDLQAVDAVQAFASEVRRRAIPPSRLLVVTRGVNSGNEQLVEYLLNRICYPVYGRR